MLEFRPPCSPSQRQRYAVALSGIAASLGVPAEQPLRKPSSQTPSTGRNLTHRPEFWPAFKPSQRHAYSVGVSGNAASLGRPAAQPLRTLSSQTPFVENHSSHIPEFVPPCKPSQRHACTDGPSGNAASLGVPAEQPLRTLSSHAPSTGSCPIAGWAVHNAQANSAPSSKPRVLTIALPPHARVPTL